MIRLLIILGCLCQAVGVGLVFWQVARLESLFPEVARWWSNLLRVLSWPFRRLVGLLRKPKPRTVQVVVGSASVATGGVEFRVKRARTGTNADQIASLWIGLDDLNREIESHQAETQAGMRAEIEARNQLRADLTEELRRQAKLLQQSTLGARGVQLLGAFLIIVGVGLLGAAAGLS